MTTANPNSLAASLSAVAGMELVVMSAAIKAFHRALDRVETWLPADAVDVRRLT